VTLLTVSVGRRPYVHETTGHILLSANGDPMAFDPTADHKCSVTARLNDTGITLDNASWVADLSSEAVLVRNKKKRRALFCPFALGSLSRACLDKSLFSEAGVTNGRRFLIAAVSFRFVSFRFVSQSFPFSLEELPPTVQDTVKITIACPGLGFTVNRYRVFHRNKVRNKRSLSSFPFLNLCFF
jgi:hypothetical protein